MSIGVMFDVTNKAVVITDCSITGDCRYCGTTICPGCSETPVFMENNDLVCLSCQHEYEVKVPSMMRVFDYIGDYLEEFPSEGAVR